ncbi:hypothetical protein DW846_14545 [Ruminococcus sp. AM36-2AA]|nr:hypothetical protein [Ruminococcus sp.]RGF86877.1 hypothetical protein DXA65_06065 [Ruminococcus sp. OF03-6AA]RGH46943.1 hypothetical protein DW894_11885 [Ruminococcus sp. AM41-10BH]RGH48826.1 hypothetical protein DW851_14580 [Ruminococcus sp. AM36-5]RGH55162.1 hypothetical protein DW846_14545 [Ruminococcus sp. AM36-2AA]RGI24433.1 hypothetical protein DXC28_06815 [Ruminococcus sp. OM08-9BH]HBB47234.1 hypothetical protein [Blautia sp.]
MHQQNNKKSHALCDAYKKVRGPGEFPGTAFLTVTHKKKIKRFFRELPLYLNIKCGMIKFRH